MRRRGPSAGPTAADVAERAKVSRSTVSRTFTPGAKVDAATRARILAAAREVGYRTETPDPLEGRTATVGLVMGGLDNPFYQTVLTTLLNRLHERGLRALCRTASTLADSDREVRTMLSHGVDAILVSSAGIHSAAIGACAAARVPVVLFNRAVPGANVSSVETDNRAGAGAVADLFVRAGHERIAFVNGLEGASTNADRRAGFLERLLEHGRPPPVEEYGEYAYEGGREAVKRLMLRPEPPQAIFCANDISALGTLDGLRSDLGLRVPQDVCVVGFDDIPMAAWPSFDLTTVRQRRNKMIDIAMANLDRLLRDPTAPPEAVVVEARLIMRGSAYLPWHTNDRPPEDANFAQ